MAWNNEEPFEILLGKTLKDINGMSVSSDEIIFTTDTGEVFRLYHSQNCCETVVIEDVVGEVVDLLNSPLTMAEEVSNYEGPNPFELDNFYHRDSYTWTYYKLGTIKGTVSLRWLGTSNGWYSESVSFERVRRDQ